MKFKYILNESVVDKQSFINQIQEYIISKMNNFTPHGKELRIDENDYRIMISSPKYTDSDYSWNIRKFNIPDESIDPGRVDISFSASVVYIGPSLADPSKNYQTTSATRYRTKNLRKYEIFNITDPIEKIFKWIDRQVASLEKAKHGTYKNT